MAKTEGLKDFRKIIDDIDVQILNLLNQRFTISKKIGEYKRTNNLAVYQPDRELEIIENLKRNNPIKENNRAIESVYQTIFNMSKSFQS